jgi:hypothetical protein
MNKRNKGSVCSCCLTTYHHKRHLFRCESVFDDIAAKSIPKDNHHQCYKTNSTESVTNDTNITIATILHTNHLPDLVQHERLTDQCDANTRNAKNVKRSRTLRNYQKNEKNRRSRSRSFFLLTFTECMNRLDEASLGAFSLVKL